jgi:hypothetical protein
VFSSIQTKEKAPLTEVSTSAAFSSRLRSGWCANSAVTSEVSFVAVSAVRTSSSPLRCARPRTRSASSRVLVRLPLWASAMDPSAVGRNVGCALCQVLAPVVE